MPQSKEVTEGLLRQAGLRPTPEEVALANRVYNILEEQMEGVSAAALEQVEPAYIQPVRQTRRRG